MKRIVIIVLILLGTAMGCARPPAQPQPSVPLNVLEENIRWARENIETLEPLPLPDTALEGLQRAKNSLALAERSFADGLYDEAYFATLESLAASQELIGQFYEESIVSPARETKRRIEVIAAEDPDSPLQEFLPMLTEILDYSEGIDPTQPDIDLSRVLSDFENIAEISQHAQNATQRTLESDLSFESGKYQLSDQGKQAVLKYCRELLAAHREVADVYPERDVTIRINITGYTDQVDFKEGTSLLTLLTSGIDPQSIPKKDAELRKFLNFRLSEFRVAALGEFMQQSLQEAYPGISVELHGTGLGEELPPGVPSSDILSDPRRRICKIYTYILVRSAEVKGAV